MTPETINHETVSTLLKYYKTPGAVRETVDNLDKSLISRDLTSLLWLVQQEASEAKIADAVRDLFFIYATKFLQDEQNKRYMG